MTSVSVSELKCAPSASSATFRSAQFSTMPFITTCTRPESSSCGWQLASVTRPWVAQRVCPMPLTAPLALPLIRSRSWERLPTARTDRTVPSVISDRPAES